MNMHDTKISQKIKKGWLSIGKSFLKRGEMLQNN